MTLGAIRRRAARAPRGAGWISCIALLFLILAAGSSHAQEVRSGWEFVESGTESDLLTGEAVNGEIWVFGKDGATGRSQDGGITWDFEPLPGLEGHSWTSSDSGFGSIVVASDDGFVFILEDIGGEIRILNDCILEIPSQVKINAISLTDNDSAVAVGSSGDIWTYYGDGDTDCDNWIDRSIEIEEELLDISFLDTVNGLISGTGGTILATTDGGATWDYRDAPAESAQSGIVAIDFFSTVRAYAITDEGQILKSSKEGTTVGVGFVWSIVEIEREYPPGGGDEFEEGGLYLDFEVSSIEVLSQFKLMMTGPNGYLAMSKDGGNIVTQQMIPVSNLTVFNGVVMQDGFRGVAIGNSGLIIRTENAGEEEFVGFEVTDFNDFGQFVDYSKERLIDGLVATVKIVLFGIAMGFSIGVILSMLKTSPTSLKNVAQVNRFQFLSLVVIPFWVVSRLIIGTIMRLTGLQLKNPIDGLMSLLREKSAHIASSRPVNVLAIRVVGLAPLVLGYLLITGTFDEVRSLNLDGWEHIYVPVGAPRAFASILLGIGLLILGAIFATCNGDFSIKEFDVGSTGKKLSLNPWGLRPLNALATVYTDLFRNTPLIVQFMFIHFGLELGRRVQEPGLDLFDFGYLKDNANFLTNIFVTYETDLSSPAYGHPIGGILEDRAYISAIFALGLNSGAYQCETIRGAIAAIPSGQMEAGRSIGLNYMQTMRLVIMPQAVRICIPPLGNEMVNLVLNSSLAMVIGYAEITRQGKLIIATTFQIFWTWGMVMISYFVITWTLALFLRYLEDKTRIPGLGISGGA
ncbi:MAG TPA: ABC transporter permease subunit [Candidatus Thalassarchaeaceae archaeon]|nr:ABC transporter permease subunit [Candidatus Thalassarchaeaceae archaeon]|tara:strand:- start:16389 stop:18797 length:2409 start_codon:yes stop_codon:yes gene_type:complete